MTTANFKVLIAEDDSAQQNILKKILSKKGFEVITADNGKEALDIILQENCNIDIVLLDMMMPIMSGQDVLDQLLAKEITPELPVIVLTALTDPEIMHTCLKKGATDFLNKPYRPEDVIARMHAHARSYKISKELQKMAILNTQKIIAAGMADTLNNRLCAVTCYGEIILNDFDKMIKGEKVVDMDSYYQIKAKYEKSVEYLNSAIRELVDYTRGLSKQYLKQVNLGKAIFPLIKSAAKGFDISYNFNPEELPEVAGDEKRIANSFNEILANACEAGKDDLKIKIETEETDDEIKISVTDNGCGMSKENLKAACLPFFSSKGTTRTGLIGLWSTKQYLDSAGGGLTIKSKENEGTTVTIKLLKWRSERIEK